ncbi:enoyl-CoA hydratase-related protein [Shewanella surugensis]|uniref:Enoyl-CoA hydratase-related protein n=1 Tax=Shewanella surugensis TaxID=212020 RepID=A0ABT0LDL7_9GAMM|nr:enoyl-CoA hydratase-related protein [Shewanella surugensis]MCL1125595.1 enoyl-CoA hydratase-related protein [Shewanella surugensis]
MSSIAEFNFIQCRVHHGVGELILNRVDKHNAFDDVMIAEMIQALGYFSAAADCQLLILKAEGKNFSAGADLGWMRRQATMDFEQNLNDANQLAQLMSTLDDFPKPTLALVQGAAFGGALGLICCCDIAIASSRARFCLSEVKLGLIPAVISPYVVRAMGARAARRYMLTAETFSADTAQKLQVIHDINDSLDLAAVSIITALKQNSPQAMAWTKTLVKRLEDGQINQATRDYTSERIARIRVSDEGQEGLNAFFDKRAPHWKVDADPQGNS